MRIFDCHYHIDKDASQYNIRATKKNIIFNDIGEYQKVAKEISADDSVSLIFDYKNNFNFVRQQIVENKIQALKIHSRIQHIAESDYSQLFTSFEQVASQVNTVIIDAFYYGSDYEYQPNLKKIIEMAKLFPSTKFIVAHSGGIKILEYFMHLRPLKNIYFDLSFSLAYLKDSSVFKDFSLLLRYGTHSNILFGTDYPFASPDVQLNCFTKIVSELNLDEHSINSILYDNADEIFQRKF